MKTVKVYRQEDYASLEEAEKDGAVYEADLTGNYNLDLLIVANLASSARDHDTKMVVLVHKGEEDSYVSDYSEKRPKWIR